MGAYFGSVAAVSSAALTTCGEAALEQRRPAAPRHSPAAAGRQRYGHLAAGHVGTRRLVGELNSSPVDGAWRSSAPRRIRSLARATAGSRRVSGGDFSQFPGVLGSHFPRRQLAAGHRRGARSPRGCWPVGLGALVVFRSARSVRAGFALLRLLDAHAACGGRAFRASWRRALEDQRGTGATPDRHRGRARAAIAGGHDRAVVRAKLRRSRWRLRRWMLALGRRRSALTS